MHIRPAAKSGVSRLTIGTARKSAITRPAMNTVPNGATQELSLFGTAETHGSELEEFATQKVTVHQEEGDDVDAGDDRSISAIRFP